MFEDLSSVYSDLEQRYRQVINALEELFGESWGTVQELLANLLEFA